MANEWVRARAPATIANVGPGFDVFALAIRGPFDEVSLRRADADRLSVNGIDADLLPATFAENAAGVVIDALRAATGIREPLEVRVSKGIPAARGLGSSASSCAAAALAFLKAFPDCRSLSPSEVIHAAVEGEASVSGRHYDNIAGALLGGFVSIASTDPLVLRREAVAASIHLALAIPEMRLKTRDMRRALPDSVPLRVAARNLGRAATLALALVRGDAPLAGRCLEDGFAEPHRAAFLPGYEQARLAALSAGGTGFALCGSGSSVFALAPNRFVAQRSAEAMRDALATAGVRAEAFVSTVNNSIPLRGFLNEPGPVFSLVPDDPETMPPKAYPIRFKSVPRRSRVGR